MCDAKCLAVKSISFLWPEPSRCVITIFHKFSKRHKSFVTYSNTTTSKYTQFLTAIVMAAAAATTDRYCLVFGIRGDHSTHKMKLSFSCFCLFSRAWGSNCHSVVCLMAFSLAAILPCYWNSGHWYNLLFCFHILSLALFLSLSVFLSSLTCCWPFAVSIHFRTVGCLTANAFHCYFCSIWAYIHNIATLRYGFQCWMCARKVFGCNHFTFWHVARIHSMYQNDCQKSGAQQWLPFQVKNKKTGITYMNEQESEKDGLCTSDS